MSKKFEKSGNLKKFKKKISFLLKLKKMLKKFFLWEKKKK